MQQHGPKLAGGHVNDGQKKNPRYYDAQQRCLTSEFTRC